MENTEQFRPHLCFCGEDFTDYQKDKIRESVCRNNEVNFKDLAGNYYCIFHYPSTEKKDEFELAFDNKIKIEDYLFYGTWFPMEIDFSDHLFKSFADFTWAKFNFEISFEKSTFENNCDFRCCQFIERVSFRKVVFKDKYQQDRPISFYSVTFENAADFSATEFYRNADFSSCKFLTSYSHQPNTQLFEFVNFSSFGSAHFKERANFRDTTFGKKQSNELSSSFWFDEVTFEEAADFRFSDFWDNANFSKARFIKSADFRYTFFRNSLIFDDAKFETFARFSGKESDHASWNKDGFRFSNVEIEKPERIFFQTVQLKPDNFRNTDIRKFDFTDIKWKVKNFAFDWAGSKDLYGWETESKHRKSNYINLEKTYRRFASYAEENNDYQSASKFRYTAFDIQRITPWYGRLPVTLLWWYKWTSRYGESWLWAFLLLTILVFGIFPSIYSKINFKTCLKDRPIAASLAICESKDEEVRKNCTCSIDQISFSDAVVHSLTTAILQNVEYRKPLTNRGELWIILEKIFVPLQAALLAFAIRRKFIKG